MASIPGKGALAVLLPLPADGGRQPCTSAPPAEAELTAEALRGDRAAWEALITRHDRKVIVSLLARGLPIDRAREVAQETWTRLIENQRAGRLREVILPGLAIVQAGYLASNDWRRQLRAPPTPESAPLENPEERAIDRQTLRQVARALERCPPQARRVFEAVYQNPELGYEELGARLGLSAQRVKQTVCEVRKRLRAELQEEIP